MIPAHLTAEPAPPTNRGVYPLSGWTASAFDYLRATVDDASAEQVVSALLRGLDAAGRPATVEEAAVVKHYERHVQLVDVRGRNLCDVFWGGQNGRPNVEAKGANAVLVAPILRAQFAHRPSRVDPMRQGTQEGLWADVVAVARRFHLERGIALLEFLNNDPDKGDTVYLGSRKSQVCIRIYQPGLKRAQEEGRTGDQISDEERNGVRIEMEFKPEKGRAKQAAASLSPDELWGVASWSADFAGEVFAMDVQPVTISERRESDRNRALRFMATQYRAHLHSLLADCQGDPSMFGSTILDLADIPHHN